MRDPVTPLALRAAVVGIVCTALPIFMTSEALRRIGANRLAIIGALGPVSTIVLGYVGLDESMTVLQLSGVLLVSIPRPIR